MELLSGTEVRRMLGISVPTYYRWLREGRLRGVRAGRDWRFPRAAVEALLRPGASPAEFRQVHGEFAALLRGLGVPRREVESMSTADGLARMLLQHAHLSRASSVHIEPVSEGFAVRERVDGALRPAGRPLPAGAGMELMRWLRRLAGLEETAESRPAKARFLTEIAGRALDVFAATYPTSTGPSMTLRLLDPETAIPPFDRLGFSAPLCAAVRRTLKRGGLFVVNGPSGCGKTTTIYSLLRELKRPDLKAMTAESPVEIAIDGVQQAEVSAQGMTFADAAKAMLYSEADVAMVAEIRDAETLQLLFGMATVGHTVLTALHAPDAVAALCRLIDVSGANRSMVADNVAGILNQRLARRNCPACAARGPVREEDARALGLSKRAGIAARGCAKCAKTGFHGVAAVGELLTITPALRRALEAGGGLDALRAAAGAGARTLRDELLEKVAAGEVSPSEAARLIAASPKEG